MLMFLIRVITSIIASSLLFFNVFVSKSFNWNLAFAVVIVYFLSILMLYSHRKPDKKYKDTNHAVVFSLCLLVISIFYLLSIRTELQVNYSCIFKGYISRTRILLIVLVLFLREIGRYLVVDNKDRKKFRYYSLIVLYIIFGVLVDINTSSKLYDLSNFDNIYDFVALTLLPSISKNILLMYLCKKNGFTLSFLYVALMDLYGYVMPVIPSYNTLIRAVILLAFPFVVYTMIEYFNSIKKKEINRKSKKRKKKKENKVLSFISTIIFIVLVCLVSRAFDYAMIGVGSGSMTGAINKGDAIIYKSYDSEADDLIVGDIIVFEANDTLIVHRVNKVYRLNGEVVYQTKGDANDSADNWVVRKESIVGIVQYRIPLIAWPSVILSELF